MTTTHTYTRDGIEVARYADGLVKWGPADRLLDNCIPPAYAAAIHAAYLAELGLWLDKETGYLVFTTPQGKAYWVLSRGDARPVVWTCHAGESTPDAPQAALDRYVATLTPPQPEPQPGEVWEVTLDDGSKARALAESRHDGKVGIRCASRCASTWAWFPDKFPDRRLLITADGEWVGGES